MWYTLYIIPIYGVGWLMAISKGTSCKVYDCLTTVHLKLIQNNAEI